MIQFLNLFGINSPSVSNMFSKIKKYVIGFFVLLGGVLIAFFSGKDAGRSKERRKDIDKKLDVVKDALKSKKKYKKDALDRIYLVSLSTILKNGTQSISWFSLDSLKEAKSKNILTIGLSNSLLHIIDL